MIVINLLVLFVAESGADDIDADGAVDDVAAELVSREGGAVGFSESFPKSGRLGKM